MSKTPWKIDKKVAAAIQEALTEKLEHAAQAMRLSNEMGRCCHDKKVIVVEMALAVMVAHIIDGYPPERKQAVFDRFIEQVLGMTE